MNSTFQTGRKRPKRKPLGLFLRFLRFVFNLSLVGCVLAVGVVVGAYLYVVAGHRAELAARYPNLPENSYVYDKNGQEIGRFVSSEARQTVSEKDLGRYLPAAAVAVEDRRFYDHLGVDFQGLGRAAWTDLLAGKVEEGGSTITEQLMKNLYVAKSSRYRVSFWRRFVQASLAFDYERNHTKGEILTSYLNTVYYGDGAYGAEVASERYFGKSAKNLDLSEAAALAGFLHAPSTYRAAGDGASYKRAVKRRDEVLRLMKSRGDISKEQFVKAKRERLRFSRRPAPDYAAYRPFLDEVRREIENRLGNGAISHGGLRIRTTLDPAMQSEARRSSQNVLYAPGDPSSAVVSVEPQTGAVRALTGESGNFDLALDARRQPGSAFKPFVLAAALKEGISPESIYLSKRLDLGGRYVINNYDHIERGDISLYDALAQSDNTVFVRLGLDVGMKNVVETAHLLGIKSPLAPKAATAIGGAATGVSPLEMASAYATFAGGGIYREPYAVEGVSKVGFGSKRTVFDHELVGRRVLSSNEAATQTNVLRGVVEHGTASDFRNLDQDLGKPSAGKTGTTDDFVDAWYVGYTPRLSTAVWVGYPNGNRSMSGVHGIAEAGGETFPLDLWSEYMSQATAGDPALRFPAPDLSQFEIRDHLTDSGVVAKVPENVSSSGEVAVGPATAETRPR